MDSHVEEDIDIDSQDDLSDNESEQVAKNSQNEVPAASSVSMQNAALKNGINGNI